MPQNRLFFFNNKTDTLQSLGFDGTLYTAENWQALDAGGTPFVLIGAATADETYSYQWTIVGWPPNNAQSFVRVYRLTDNAFVRQFQPRSQTAPYRSMLHNDTHVIMVCDSPNAQQLEFYRKTNDVYEPALDQTLPPTTGQYQGACRAGGFLYIGWTDNSPNGGRVYKRNLDGTAVSDFAVDTSRIRSMVGKRNSLLIVGAAAGVLEERDLDGNDINNIVSFPVQGFVAAYSTFGDTPSVPTYTSVVPYSVREVGDLRIDSSDFFSGHTSLSFRSDYTPPSWLSIEDGDIVITDAPDVSQTQAFTIFFTAGNDGGRINGAIVLNVVPNNPPVFDPTSYTITRAAIAVDAVIATITATDADADTLSYTLTGTDAGRFQINSSGRITVRTQLAYETTYTFNVVASDPSMAEDSATVTVTTGAQPNVAPQFPQASYTFDAIDIAVGTVVGTVAAMDSDMLTYRLTGTDASRFEIDASGQITVATELGYVQTYTFNVVADDGTETVSVSVSLTTRQAPVEPPVEPPEPELPTTRSKDLSYQGHPIALSAKIHDIDVTDDITALDDITQGIDYPNLTEFRVGEASFTLRDIHGDFSPNNAANFFTQHGGQRTGRNSPIEIEAGFIVDGTTHTETIFKGTIIRLVQDAKAATVKVICSDNFGDMRKKTIADFGVSRHFMLTADVAQSSENGVYPIMDAVLPASDGSVSLATRTGETLKPVQKLETEGTLNPRNFSVDAAGVRTEGGLIVDRQVGYPQLRMKSPFRYRHIEDVITDILNHAGISDSEIEIPEQDVNSHFSSNGRISYNLLGNIGSSNPITWNGYVTDFLYDAGKWYFLYNKHRNNPNGISQVIEYDAATRTYTQLHQFAAAVEVWKFTKVGDVLYILASTGGNYDANEPSSENKIIRLDISGTPTATDFVAETAARQPQLSHYYAGVGSVHHKPDSRRQLIYHQNGLYYAYCDRGNSQFGIAKATAQNTTTAIITINLDNYENHGGLAFDIDASGVLHGATTFLSGARSQTLVFKKAL